MCLNRVLSVRSSFSEKRRKSETSGASHLYLEVPISDLLPQNDDGYQGLYGRNLHVEGRGRGRVTKMSRMRGGKEVPKGE